jgi:copper(I)-binding protein
MAAMIKAFAAALALVALTSCNPQASSAVGAFKVEHAMFAPPAGLHGVTAGYFTLQNTGAADTLLSVSAPVAASIEMHESTTENGMMAMKRLDRVEVPAGGIVAFEPGGKHLMMFGVKSDIALGSKATFTFTFANAGQKEYTFTVTALGEMAH